MRLKITGFAEFSNKYEFSRDSEEIPINDETTIVTSVHHMNFIMIKAKGY